MNIVLVDDDVLVGDALALVLRDAGHDVWLGKDPATALAHMRAGPVDIVVTDLKLGASDGVAFIIELRNQFPLLPVIAISGGGTDGSSFEVAKAAGADVCMNKPFTGRALLRAIEDLTPNLRG